MYFFQFRQYASFLCYPYIRNSSLPNTNRQTWCRFAASSNFLSCLAERIISLELLYLPYHPHSLSDFTIFFPIIMHAIGIPDQYIMQRGGWSSDKTLKAIYRGTIKDYEEKYTDMTLSHFEGMQHEMQHEKEKP